MRCCDVRFKSQKYLRGNYQIILDGCQSYVDYLDKWKPKLPADLAKLIVWGFVAGFSERFVPNILNKIASDEKK